MFGQNLWPAAWRKGVYRFHHFHSNAHKALGVYSGEVTVQFGGEHGVAITARSGDVIVLPAGQHPDTCRPAPSDLARNEAAVARAALPECDPVYGAKGPLFLHWKK